MATTTKTTTEERPPTPNPLTLTCHCGQTSITVPHKPKYLNECRCTVCYKYGALWGYYPRSAVRVSINSNPSISDPTSDTSDITTSDTTTTANPDPNNPSDPNPSHDDTKGRGEGKPKPKVTIQKYIRTGQTLEDNPPRQHGSLSFDRCSHCGCVLCWDRATPFSSAEGEVDNRKMGVNFRMVAPSDAVGMRWLEGVERFVSTK
jgi:hypothetical protein